MSTNARDWIELIAGRVHRYEQFYASNRPGDLLVVVRQNPYWIRKRNLFEYDFTAGGHLQMAEDMAQSAEVMLRASAAAGDDLIPWLCPDFGIACHHTYVIDGPVQFAEWTSWAEHPLAGPDGYARLAEVRYDPANRWVRLIQEMIAYWRARPEQPYLVNGHYHFSPLDLANALRGNDLFTDFYECPDQVTELLRRCTETIIAFEEDLRRRLGARVGLPFWGALAPADALFVSEDAMDLCGPQISAQWGQPWTTKLREHFGRIAIHHHMLGACVQPVLGAIAQRSLVQISNDPNCPAAAAQLAALGAASGDNALMFDCDPAALPELRPVLARQRAVVVLATGDDLAAARTAVARIRAWSNVAAAN